MASEPRYTNKITPKMATVMSAETEDLQHSILFSKADPHKARRVYFAQSNERTHIKLYVIQNNSDFESN
jgi:hypothetical protein